MSTTAASSALRRCLRSKSTLEACRRNIVASRQACIASSICPARTLSSTTAPLTSPSSRPSSRSPILPIRHYSSSIQGTIGAGEAGVPTEAAALTAPEHLNEKEREIWGMLQRELAPTKLEVQDVSGGCGSMYAIEVQSERFRGLSMLKQQRLVNQVLGEEIKGWHGVQLRTSVP